MLKGASVGPFALRQSVFTRALLGRASTSPIWLDCKTSDSELSPPKVGGAQNGKQGPLE